MMPDVEVPELPRQRPLVLGILLFFVVLVAGLWLAIAQQLAELGQAAEAGARRDLSNLSLAFGEHIRSLSQGLDQTLVSLRQQWVDDRTRFDASVHRYTQAVAQDYNIQIAVIGRNGRLAYSNLNPDARPIDLSDRAHFKVHRERDADSLDISEPVLGRVSKRWSIQFTRPILDRNDQFAGVIVMSVAPEYFSNFYQRIGLGEGGVVTLIRRSGEVLARWPPLDMAIGTRVGDLLPPAGNGQGVVTEFRSPIDDELRIYALRALPELGLIVSVGQSVRAIEATTADQRDSLILVGAGASVAILAFALSLLSSLATRARAQRRLARARERDRVLLTALESVPSGIIVTDAESRIQWVNPAFLALTGYSMEEAIGKKPSELVKSGVQAPPFYESMWARLRSGAVWRGELVNRRKDGSQYDEELMIAPVGDESGQTTHFVGIKLDVTERKRAQLALANESERNELLLRMATDGILIVDGDCRIVEANNAYANLVGFSRDELLRMGIGDIDACLSLGQIGSMVAELFDGRCDRRDFETRHRRVDGQLVDVEVSVGRVSIGDDALLYCSVRDITERKRLAAATRENEQLWRFALDGSGVGVFDWHMDTGEISFSASANALLGIEPDDPVKRIEDWEARVHPLDERVRREAISTAISSESGLYQCEYRYRIPSGHWKWILSRGAVIRRETDGTPQRMVGTFADIDAEKRKREQAALRTRVMESLTRGGSMEDVLAMTLRGLERNNFGLLFAMMSEAADHCLSVDMTSDMGRYLLGGRAFDYEGEITSVGNSLCLGEEVHLPEGGNAFWASLQRFAASVGLVACWAEPVALASGQLNGVLVAFGREEQRFVPPDLPEMQQSAALIGIAIHRKRTDEALRLAASVYEASSESVMVVDPQNRIVAINPAFTATTGYTLDDIFGHDPKILSSGRHDASFYQDMWHSIMTTGSWRGEIWNRRKSGEEFVEWVSINTVLDEAGEVQRRVAVFIDISDRKAAEEMVWRKANYDGLTGLPNRQLFMDRVQHALTAAERDQEVVGLLFVDLDHFKDVNDTLGHEMGDLMLQEAARRIRACVRQSDTVARMGGDEFTVLLPSLDTSLVAERIAQQVTERLAEPFQLGAEVAYASASVGITLYPEDGQTTEMLFKQADQAMYAAKAAGRNRYSWFTPQMRREAELRHSLANDIRTALAENQFELHYQPIMCLRTGQVSKAEALIRWHHPERGPISPGLFIPIAEDTGLINDIGHWVSQEALQTLVRWNSSTPERGRPRICISVNRSPREFLTPGTHEEWVHTLRAHGVPPEALIVEITEGLLLDDREEVTSKLSAFRDRGIQLALDDFGTGYSAMSYLQRYDIDFLKIDRSFVKHLATSSRDRAIADAVIAMAHALGIRVIAEGVEHEDQRDLLAAAGCDFMQGYLCAPALPAHEFESRFLSASAP